MDSGADSSDVIECFKGYHWLLKEMSSLDHFDALLPALNLTIRQVRTFSELMINVEYAFLRLAVLLIAIFMNFFSYS